ncbi:DUF1330 domain-containing protein [Gordonia sp. LSe1-13]|uniref:DUF1330 domain-containing protein n=2 Tax=Gordonia TaxID=2053 RepID=A0ABU7MEI1_9ACTN|nr:DUF1330 domain-containing protein [Gordonia sp. LSe1-13]MEE4024374.1 DUF1330 domain-containing protein [Gordonia sp. PKS22-38]
MPVTFAVLLWSVAGREQQLHAYEDDVLRLVGEHGGRVIARARRVESDSSHPVETQIIEFADTAGFDSYMVDPRRTSMSERRDACVERTEVWPIEMI